MGRPPYLTPEEREASRIRQNKRRSLRTLEKRTAKRAAKALAEGREPGKVGQPRILTDEQRKANRKASYQKWLAKKLDERRKRDAAIHRLRRAEKAVAEGREPGRIGREKVYADDEWRERRKELHARSLAANPEKHHKWSRSYYDRHKEEAVVKSRNRRAKKRGNGGKHGVDDVRALWAKQRGICAFCNGPLGDKKPHVDHWIPLARGGSNGPENLRLLHGFCNGRKGAKMPSEFGLPDRWDDPG